MKSEKTPEIRSINYMKKVKLRVERGKSGYTAHMKKDDEIEAARAGLETIRR